MLDASTVISPGSGFHTFTLGAATPEIIIDGGSGGASVPVTSGTVLASAIDNSYTPTGAWATIAAGATVSVGAGARRIVRAAGGPGGAVLGRLVWS